MNRQELYALLDLLAGNEHTDRGTVRTALDQVLDRHAELLRVEWGLPPRHGDVPEISDAAVEAFRCSAEYATGLDLLPVLSNRAIRAGIQAVYRTDRLAADAEQAAYERGVRDATLGAAQAALDEAAWHYPDGLADPADLTAQDKAIADAFRKFAGKLRKHASGTKRTATG